MARRPSARIRRQGDGVARERPGRLALRRAAEGGASADGAGEEASGWRKADYGPCLLGEVRGGRREVLHQAPGADQPHAGVPRMRRRQPVHRLPQLRRRRGTALAQAVFQGRHRDMHERLRRGAAASDGGEEELPLLLRAQRKPRRRLRRGQDMGRNMDRQRARRGRGRGVPRDRSVRRHRRERHLAAMALQPRAQRPPQRESAVPRHVLHQGRRLPRRRVLGVARAARRCRREVGARRGCEEARGEAGCARTPRFLHERARGALAHLGREGPARGGVARYLGHGVRHERRHGAGARTRLADRGRETPVLEGRHAGEPLLALGDARRRTGSHGRQLPSGARESEERQRTLRAAGNHEEARFPLRAPLHILRQKVDGADGRDARIRQVHRHGLHPLDW